MENHFEVESTEDKEVKRFIWAQREEQVEPSHL